MPGMRRQLGHMQTLFRPRYACEMLYSDRHPILLVRAEQSRQGQLHWQHNVELQR